jgi:hypothetical protein
MMTRILHDFQKKSFSHDFHKDVSDMIRPDGIWFKDGSGRTVLLRGVNLGGSTKVPLLPDGATYINKSFFDHRNVSFVGRPFPLEEADEHFRRLKEWGLTFLRFLVTWEAIEHSGPGIYDEAYLDYVYMIAKKAGEYGFTIFVDPHQDVWSRFSGGDGAPGWTFEVVGLDITKFDEAGAAIRHQIHGDPFPRMIWSTNGQKLAAATMFTIFFGGNDFAPAVKVGGEPIQDFLQEHYIASVMQMAERLKEFSHVIGYDTMNEPFSGYIGWQDLREAGGYINLGSSPTPYQSMLLGAGFPQEVDVYKVWVAGGRKSGTRMLNSEGVSVWLPGFDPIWRKNGVWDLDSTGKPQLLRPDHFKSVNGRDVDFSQDYLRPFFRSYAEGIHAVDPDAMIFIEDEFGHEPPFWGQEASKNIIWAPHWYDGFTVLLKRFSPWIAANAIERSIVIGRKNIHKSFVEQVGCLKHWAQNRLGSVPTVIGEFGIPFDMNHKRAYRTGDFSNQINAMDRSFKAMEGNLVSCTLWNYTADNTNERGDQWNDEDFSIFSPDQQEDPGDIHSGGRALDAVVRPYAMRVAGEPLEMSFDLHKRVFELTFRHDPDITAPTVVFVPNFQYPDGYLVEISDGEFSMEPDAQQLLYLYSPSHDVHTIRVMPQLSSQTPD